MLAVSAHPVRAQDTSPAENTLEIPDESAIIISEGDPLEETGLGEVPIISTWDFIRMLLILAVVVGVIYLIFFMLKRALRKRMPENDLILLIGSRSLSGNKALHLVEVGRSIFLIGSADGGISLISEIQDRESMDLVRLENARTSLKNKQSFSDLLQAVFKPAGRIPAGRQVPAGEREIPAGEGEGEGENKPGVAETVDFMKQQRERLKRLRR